MIKLEDLNLVKSENNNFIFQHQNRLNLLCCLGFILVNFTLFSQATKQLLGLFLAVLFYQYSLSKHNFFKTTPYFLCFFGLLLFSFYLGNHNFYIWLFFIGFVVINYLYKGKFSVIGCCFSFFLFDSIPNLISFFAYEFKIMYVNGLIYFLKPFFEVNFHSFESLLFNNYTVYMKDVCLGSTFYQSAFFYVLFLIISLKNQIKNYFLLLLLVAVVVFATFANFLRIMILIIFGYLEDNMIHQSIGIISFFIYCLLPLYFLFQRMKSLRIVQD